MAEGDGRRIRLYLCGQVELARGRGDKTVTFRAGDVHKALGLENRMPNVCQVQEGDEGFILLRILHEAPLPNAADSSQTSSPSEDYLAVVAGQRQWIATTNFAGCPGQPQIALRIAPCSLPRQSS